ncbi:hypothetical protein ACFX13_034248 [Malus domestica]|uniref:Uncharacterized protein n=1 Tax=Malus domestica TaxID=3750 RepID=A0A498K966_MALDO|nr:hypothetical protein DVH24_015291 [Malus domestica]
MFYMHTHSSDPLVRFPVANGEEEGGYASRLGLTDVGYRPTSSRIRARSQKRKMRWSDMRAYMSSVMSLVGKSSTMNNGNNHCAVTGLGLGVLSIYG